MEKPEEVKFLGSENIDYKTEEQGTSFMPTKDGVCTGSAFDEESALDIERKERGHWGNKAEFFLAIMGYTIGIGSVWRFPIICR